MVDICAKYKTHLNSEIYLEHTHQWELNKQFEFFTNPVWNCNIIFNYQIDGFSYDDK